MPLSLSEDPEQSSWGFGRETVKVILGKYAEKMFYLKGLLSEQRLYQSFIQLRKEFSRTPAPLAFLSLGGERVETYVKVTARDTDSRKD